VGVRTRLSGRKHVPLRVNSGTWRQTQMLTRIYFLVVSIAITLVSAAACSSTNDKSTETCDVEEPCRLADDAGNCSGPLIASGACKSCPAGYVNALQCKNDDAGTGNDAASDADAGGVCQVEVLCYEVNDAGICEGTEFSPGACKPCPAGAVAAGVCTFADGGR
jgi:hypothetical protein